MPDKIYFKSSDAKLRTELFPRDLIQRKSHGSQLKLTNLNMTKDQMELWLYELIMNGVDPSSVKIQFSTGKIFSNPNQPQNDTQKALFERFQSAKSKVLAARDEFFKSFPDSNTAKKNYRLLAKVKVDSIKFGLDLDVMDEKNNLKFWEEHEYALERFILHGMHHVPGIQAYLKGLIEFVDYNNTIHGHTRLEYLTILKKNGVLDNEILELFSQGKISDDLQRLMAIFSSQENVSESFKRMLAHPHLILLINILKKLYWGDNEKIKFSELIQNLTSLNDEDLKNLHHVISELNKGHFGNSDFFSSLQNFSFLKGSNPSLMISVLKNIFESPPQSFERRERERFLILISQYKHEYLPIILKMVNEIGVVKAYQIIDKKLPDTFLDALVIPNLEKIKKFENLGVFLKLLETASTELKQSLIANPEKFVDILNHHDFSHIMDGDKSNLEEIRQYPEIVDFLLESPNTQDFTRIVKRLNPKEKNFREICQGLIKYQDLSVLDKNPIGDKIWGEYYQQIFSHPDLNSIIQLNKRLNRYVYGDDSYLPVLLNLPHVAPLLDYLAKNPEYEQVVRKLISSNRSDAQRLQWIFDNSLFESLLDILSHEARFGSDDIADLIEKAQKTQNPKAYLEIVSVFGKLDEDVHLKLLRFPDIQILEDISKTDLKYLSASAEKNNLLRFLMEKTKLNIVQNYLEKVFKEESSNYRFMNRRYPFFEMLMSVPEVLNLGEKFDSVVLELYQILINMDLNPHEILQKICALENATDLCRAIVGIAHTDFYYSYRTVKSDIKDLFTSNNLAEIARFCGIHPNVSLRMLKCISQFDNIHLFNQFISEMQEHTKKNFLTILESLNLVNSEQINLIITSSLPLELAQLLKDYHLLEWVKIDNLRILSDATNLLAVKKLMDKTSRESDSFSHDRGIKLFFQMLHDIPQILNFPDHYDPAMFGLYEIYGKSIQNFPDILVKLLSEPDGVHLCRVLMAKSVSTAGQQEIQWIFTYNNFVEIARFCGIYTNTSPRLVKLLSGYKNLNHLNDILSAMPINYREGFLATLEKLLVSEAGIQLLDDILAHQHPLNLIKLVVDLEPMKMKEPEIAKLFNELAQHPKLGEVQPFIKELKDRYNLFFVKKNLITLLQLEHPALIHERMRTVSLKTFNTYPMPPEHMEMCFLMIDKLSNMPLEDYQPVIFKMFKFLHRNPEVSKVFSKIWEHPNWANLCSMLNNAFEQRLLSVESLVEIVLSNRLSEISEFLASCPNSKDVPWRFILFNEHLPWLSNFLTAIGENSILFRNLDNLDAHQINFLMQKLMSMSQPLKSLSKVIYMFETARFSQKSPIDLSRHLEGFIHLAEKLQDFDNQTSFEVYQRFSSLDPMLKNLSFLMEMVPLLDGYTLVRIASYQNLESLMQILSHLQSAQLLDGEQGLNNISFLLGQNNLETCEKNIQTLKDSNKLNQRSFERIFYQNNLMEPINEKYVMVDENYNHVHLLLPVSSGQEIALDNTCQSTQSLKEFFGYQPKLKSCQVILNEHVDALLRDIAILRPDTELCRQKKERLEHLMKYQASLNEVKLQEDIIRLRRLYPEYPMGIQRLMHKQDSNLYSIQLMPDHPDGMLRTINPKFSLRNFEDTFKQQLSTTLDQNRLSVMSLREHFITQVLNEASKEPALTFERLQDILHDMTLSYFGEQVNYRAVDISTICDLLGIEEGDLAKETRSFVEGLLGFAARDLFNSKVVSPFCQESLNNEKLSILIQFYLAEINIYCQQKGIGHENFGLKLQDRELQNAFMTCLRELKGDVEFAIAEFVNRHAERFGLSRGLDPSEVIEIKKKFAEHFFLVKDSPHFDEFMILNLEKNGGFYSHQASICVDYLDFLKESMPKHALNEDSQMSAILRQSKTLPVKLAHQNLWLDPGRNVGNLSVPEMCELVEKGYPLGFLMAKLDDLEQIEVLKKLGERVFDILAYPKELQFIQGNFSKKAVEFLMDCAIAYGRTEVQTLMPPEKKALTTTFAELSHQFAEESKLIRSLLAGQDDEIAVGLEKFPSMPQEFINAVIAQPHILKRINEVLVERGAPLLEKPEDLIVHRNKTAEFRQKIHREAPDEHETHHHSPGKH